jgi:hypothetical protein
VALVVAFEYVSISISSSPLDFLYGVISFSGSKNVRSAVSLFFVIMVLGLVSV